MYDAEKDYIKGPKGKDDVWKPTDDDPLCARKLANGKPCGWPKHHHRMGLGELCFPHTEDQCPGFVFPAAKG